MTDEASSTVAWTSSAGPSTAVISSCSTQNQALLKAKIIQKYVQRKTSQQMQEIYIQKSRKERCFSPQIENRQSITELETSHLLGPEDTFCLRKCIVSNQLIKLKPITICFNWEGIYIWDKNSKGITNKYETTTAKYMQFICSLFFKQWIPKTSVFVEHKRPPIRPSLHWQILFI